MDRLESARSKNATHLDGKPIDEFEAEARSALARAHMCDMATMAVRYALWAWIVWSLYDIRVRLP